MVLERALGIGSLIQVEGPCDMDFKRTGFNEAIQRQAAGYAWMSSCNNWFKTASGKLVNNWPSPTLRFFVLTRFLDASNYQITRR